MIFDRFECLVGKEALAKLNKSNVIVFGLGGVGGHVVETLVRSGLGYITVVDSDTFEETNLNRQILATHSTIGLNKVDVCAKRCRDINPDIIITAIKAEFGADFTLDFAPFDYIVDCVDDVGAKVEIIRRAQSMGKKVITCLGTAKKFDPQKLEVSKLSKTKVCPLAAVMRKKLREGIIADCTCVYSTETPHKCDRLGSTAFVPSVAGILIAKTVILDLIKG